MNDDDERERITDYEIEWDLDDEVDCEMDDDEPERIRITIQNRTWMTRWTMKRWKTDWNEIWITRRNRIG